MKTKYVTIVTIHIKSTRQKIALNIQVWTQSG